jgi:hypothetical protein
MLDGRADERTSARAHQCADQRMSVHHGCPHRAYACADHRAGKHIVVSRAAGSEREAEGGGEEKSGQAAHGKLLI